MALGLLRILVLTIIGTVEAYRRNSDRLLPWKDMWGQTAGWLFPIRRLWRKRPFHSTISILFHVGLLVVPLFLSAHILLWQKSTGLSWPAIPQQVADWLTLVVLITGPALFLDRLLRADGRAISRRQDYLWPLLLTIPFGTGYVCSNGLIGPKTYQVMMLMHVYSGNLILLLMPFTKIAHCVLAPLSQFVTAIAWKFPAGAGDRVAATLGYADRPSWVEKSRLGRKVELPGIFEGEPRS
jgi:nitrate reductase gamma subunit